MRSFRLGAFLCFLVLATLESAQAAPAVPTSQEATASVTAPATDATPDANSDQTHMPVTPPPAISTQPPGAMSDAEAQKQVVVLDTSLGQIVIELNDVAAPRTCGNFRKLVSDGFYDHTIFHRVIPRFIIQGGDPNSKTDDRASYGQGDPGYSLPAEIELKHTAGAVAMARLPDTVNPRRDSNGCQFYICVVDCPSLDGQYTVFGRVIRGLDVAEKIANAPRDAHNDPVDRIEMKAHLDTKRAALAGAASSA